MSKNLFALLVLIAGLMAALVVFTGGNNKSDTSNQPPALNKMVGQPASDFNLMSYDGQPWQLSSQRGKKVVLFFSEGIMCYPACWNQMAALGTDKELNNKQVVSASIVTDTAEQWSQAVSKMPELGKGTILMDADKTVSRQYGMLTLGSSMHPGNTPGHTYLLLDEKGVVRWTLDDPAMGIHNAELIKQLAQI